MGIIINISLTAYLMDCNYNLTHMAAVVYNGLQRMSLFYVVYIKPPMKLVLTIDQVVGIFVP